MSQTLMSQTESVSSLLEMSEDERRGLGESFLYSKHEFHCSLHHWGLCPKAGHCEGPQVFPC